MPDDILAPRRVLRIGCLWQIEPAEGFEILLAGVTEALATAGQRLLNTPSTLYFETISLVTSVMNWKL